MVDLRQPASAGIWPEYVRGHWKPYFSEGAILVLLGLAAIIIPGSAELGAVAGLGWLFLVAGLAGAVATFMNRYAPGFWWSLISAAVTLVAGAFLLGPLGVQGSLTPVVATYLVGEGVACLVYAYQHQGQLAGRWGWLFLNGVIDILLALIMIWLFPAAAVGVIGLIVGIDFILGGASLISMALAARDGL